MRKLGQIAVVIMLSGIIVLQILAALKVFPAAKVVRVCPVSAITMQNGKAVIDSTKCIGCKRCVAGTPVSGNPARANPTSSVTTQSKNLNPRQEILLSKSENDTKPAVSKDEPANKQPLQVKRSYVVDTEQCIGCTLCVNSCPVGAISMVAGKAVIDKNKCIECGICKNGDNQDFTGCPVSAISQP